MAGGEVIGAAISILLLILVGYVLVGSTLTSAEVVATAQKDMTAIQEERLGTSIFIKNAVSSVVSGKTFVDFKVQNNGNQIIRDFNNINVMLVRGTDTPNLYNVGSGALTTNTWKNDGLYTDTSGTSEIIDPLQWNPSEYLYGHIEVDPALLPNQIKVILANGVTAETSIPSP